MSSGAKAVEHIAKLARNGRSVYKVILCDFCMPELDGPQTTVQIRDVCRSLNIEQPFIACITAYDNDSFKKVA